jgi:DNA-binding response OmpR family regulator
MEPETSAIPLAGPGVDFNQVLLVRPDPVNLQTWSVALYQAGFHVRNVTDGLQAWNEMATWSPEVVVTDLDLPELDGIELCRRLRRDPRTVDALILGLSPATSATDYVRAMGAGFDSILYKPRHPSMLLDEIARVRVRAAVLRRRADALQERAADVTKRAAHALLRSQVCRDRREFQMSRDQAISQIRSDYLELPTLSLTILQAARLWALDARVCGPILDELRYCGFLIRRDGMYSRP